MLVKSLRLNDFRNYQHKIIDFKDGINIIVGKNGVGKTNILESLIVVSNTKSFRTLEDNDLIQKNKEYSLIECLSDENKYKVVLSKNAKKLYINNILIKKTSLFIGEFNCILFKPSDLNLFNNSPRERRRLLDIEIGKVSRKYLSSLLENNLLLKDKNKLLKEENIDFTYLDIIDEKLILVIEKIIKYRQEFINIINLYINNYYHKFSNKKDNIKIIYKKCSDIANIKDELRKSREKDLIYHYASFGIHHEDYDFYMNDIKLEKVASQGQMRMTVLAFKLSLYEYIKQKTGKVPILLLDDVLSELDNENKKRLLNIIPKDAQIIITCTDLNGIEKNKVNLIEIKENENV